MTAKCKLAVVGAGLIGKTHAGLILSGIPGVELAAIVDPTDAARGYAASRGIGWFASLSDMFSSSAKPDGAIIATPNQMHVENGLECVAHNCPVLVEKPIATSSTQARLLVDGAAQHNVPVLVGHHRRHNPIIQKAKALIEGGELGQIKLVNATFWVLKPDDGYFAPEWRRKRGAGPVMVNSVHDMDLMRYLCGDIASVHSISSNSTRNFEVEDTAVTMLKFKSGVLGTYSLSDTVAAPWSWEMTSGENPDFTKTQESCYTIGGTKGSLSIPDLRVWRYEQSWKGPVNAKPLQCENSDPLVSQIAHFADIINKDVAPLVSGEEGLKSLKVVEAILQSAETGETVHL